MHVRNWLTVCALVCSAAAGAASPIDPSSKDPVARGEYVAHAADCISCHTAEGGKPFAGGNVLQTPFGIIYGTNITPDAQTGIGQWTREDFARAVRQGVRKDGAYLYPAMPYGSYAKITDADLDDLWAYLRSVTPVQNRIPANTLPFPFSVRSGLAAWRGLYFDSAAFVPTAAKGAAWNRGAYLVTALGHCDECHTPRNVAQGLETQHELTGATIQGWYAPDISSGASSSIHGWSSAQLVSFLKSGAMPNNGKAVGPMLEVVQHSLQYLKDSDVRAMALYLKDQPGSATPQKADAVKFARLDAGKAVYEDNCASCHQSNGQGIAKSVPGLAGNDAVAAREPYNVIMAVLEGFKPQGTWGAMGSFANSLSDDQIADVTNYVRTAWSNQGTPNATPWSVSTWRKQATVSNTNQSEALLCPDLKDTVLQPALALGTPALKQAATDRKRMAQLVGSYRAAAPKASTAEVIEALSTAYCRVLVDEHLSEARMGAQLSDYAQQIAISAKPHAS